MNRAELQQLAEDRLLDVQALLAAGRWSGAYYLAGYAVECGLKSCVLVYIINNTGVIFQERNFGSRCWTHDLEELLKLARLEADLTAEMQANPAFAANWTTIKDWTEASRYAQTAQLDAEQIVEAIADPANGVLQWIKNRW